MQKKLKVKVSSSFRRICYVLNYKYGLKLTMLGRRNVIIDFEQTDFVTTQTFWRQGSSQLEKMFLLK